jgi:plastocyanin
MKALSLAVLAAFLALAASARAEDTVIQIENFTFNPAEVTIEPGTTVTWKNADDIPHSVVENDTKFRSKPLDTGESFSMTFTDPGEVGYFCGLHPHRKGKIVVKP